MLETKTLEEKIIEIGSVKALRVERWRDEYKHWRAGIEWYGEGDYEFLVEQPTLEKCLDIIIRYLDGKEPIKNTKGGSR